MSDDYTPPRDILLNRAYNAITRADYTPESIEAAIETLFDATRTAALEEAAVIVRNNFGRSWVAWGTLGHLATAIRAAKDGAQ